MTQHRQPPAHPRSPRLQRSPAPTRRPRIRQRPSQQPTTKVSDTTQASTTTVSPQDQAITALATYQSTGDRAGLALLSPLSPAYFYYDGLVILAEHGDPLEPSRTTPVTGGFRISPSAGST